MGTPNIAQLRWEAERREARKRGLVTTREAAQMMGVPEHIVKTWKRLGLITDHGGGKGHPSLFDPQEVRTAPARRRNLRARGTCSVQGCDRPHKAKGKCNSHYRRDLKAAGRIASKPSTPEQNAEYTLRRGGFIGPCASSPYRVLARSCPSCGDLLTTPPGLLRKDSGELPPCRKCHLARIRNNTRKRQAQTLERAVNNGKQWTGPEMELVLRGDMSVRELALALGRTMNAVRYIKRQLVEKQDPRYVNVAGMTPALERKPR